MGTVKHSTEVNYKCTYKFCMKEFGLFTNCQHSNGVKHRWYWENLM